MPCITLITDGIDSIVGPIQVAYLLGSSLVKSGLSVNVVSPYMWDEVKRVWAGRH